jgi:hypothetical protein
VDTVPVSSATLRVLLRISALAIEGQVVAPLDRLAFQWDAAAVEAREALQAVEARRVADALPW